MTLNPYQPPASPTDASLLEAARIERRQKIRSQAWLGAKFGGQVAATITGFLSAIYLFACAGMFIYMLFVTEGLIFFDQSISDLFQMLLAIVCFVLLSTILGALAGSAVTTAAAWAGVGKSARLSNAAREIEPRG